MEQKALMQPIDKSQIPPLHQKRILAFVNQFLISSSTFLSNFALNCEAEFIKLERKIQKLEAALTIIEAKLDSVPDGEQPAVTSSTVATQQDKEVVEDNCTQKTTNSADNTVDIPPTDPVVEEDTEEPPPPIGVQACQDERYKKFFKMVQFGVPAEAVKIKMSAEGVDPNILDTPQLILTDGIQSAS